MLSIDEKSLVLLTSVKHYTALKTVKTLKVLAKVRRNYTTTVALIVHHSVAIILMLPMSVGG